MAIDLSKGEYLPLLTNAFLHFFFGFVSAMLRTLADRGSASGTVI
jgi:hypothetical protein